MFFSFDGIDGVGKTTQIERFCAWLAAQGHTVVTCRDPGSTPLGETLRDVLLHSGDDRPIGRRAEMLLYMAARAQLVDDVIRPALDAGSVVVSDRYLLANLAYQAHAGGLPREAVASVGAVATDGVAPAAVMLLDLSPAAAERRMGDERDRMERSGAEYRERLRQGFLEEARKAPDVIHVVDASPPVDEVHARIVEIAQRVLDHAAAR
ncbi:Thymidylate kinase [Pseudobythopirellula maris]|uniref:Thymidylate kinase n=1 Tax=Pseudobythopirellula maris TaxID=2527991 RepID=A0A5C5ZQ74_9BACT|nr:dTMP kinase [Pseudobythopirellula maris]TWT88961.1 Thymidylate kinase [Pseudobythopirellula maris]